ncbi:hypothetical protein RHGRI_012994 [Rhododendron griersonianum]|uniref:Uncharacterized protein n=1 Tax=Rhododendron griersonianum TaxID=479676 RepID=A0AAV6K4B3_9ERIC|nr:hypothetical protein RHGRI_012994 [Rhododendron griersonianum]
MGRRKKEEIMALGNLGTDSLGNHYGLWEEDEFNRGFQLDYVFDWTILEYQQSQITAPPSRALGPGTGRSSKRPPLVANAQRQLEGEKEGRLPGLPLVDYESALKGIESLHFDDKESLAFGNIVWWNRQEEENRKEAAFILTPIKLGEL